MAGLESALRKGLYWAMGRWYPAYAFFAEVRSRRLSHSYGRRGAAEGEPPTMIYMCDGQRGANGGLTDRLRGMTSMYWLCKEHGWRFRIWFKTPFDLEDYLVPFNYDWRIADSEISFDRATPAFCMNLVDGRSNEFALRYMLSKMKRTRLIHVYSNVCFSWERFPALYAGLFRPSDELARQKEHHLAQLGGPYIAVTLRFQQLLGDFDEGGAAYSTILPEAGRELLIGQCLGQLAQIYAENGGTGRVLVTSDSTTFLRRAAGTFDWVYTIPGELVHLDFTSGAARNAYMKSFVDFAMLGGARRACLVTGGGMYRSGFARAAALLNGVPYAERDF